MKTEEHNKTKLSMLQKKNKKEKNAIFVPEIWLLLQLSSKGLFFGIWIQKVCNLAIFIQLVNSIHFLTLIQGYFRLFRHFCDE
ncbi:hypothetical protein Hanom_Chr14g01330651 [Helianthus anomalus]